MPENGWVSTLLSRQHHCNSLYELIYIFFHLSHCYNTVMDRAVFSTISQLPLRKPPKHKKNNGMDNLKKQNPKMFMRLPRWFSAVKYGDIYESAGKYLLLRFSGARSAKFRAFTVYIHELCTPFGVGWVRQKNFPCDIIYHYSTALHYVNYVWVSVETLLYLLFQLLLSPMEKSGENTHRFLQICPTEERHKVDTILELLL